jgi:hypothetical protein
MNEEIPTEKQCTKCLIIKPLEEFFCDKSKKDGRRGECKACVKKRDKKYKELKKDQIRENKKKYYQLNKEVIIMEKKKYRKKNKERLSLYYKKYYEKNKERLNKRSREYNKKNREIILEWRRNYKKRNPKETQAADTMQRAQKRKQKLAISLLKFNSTDVQESIAKRLAELETKK